MPSERTKLENNTNESKNTRMDITKSFVNFDIRKDKIMHIARYFKAVTTMQELAKELGRPIKVLELGCGECYTMQLFYKAIVQKKSEVVAKYIGVDIDEPMLNRVKQDRANMLSVCNGKLIAQDLTTTPHLKLRDGSYDMVICCEMFEHIKPKFVEPIVQEIARVVNQDGIILISTPNRNGGTGKLPADHVYEWGYKELKKTLQKHLIIVSEHGMGVNLSTVPKEEKKRLKTHLDALNGAYGKGSYFTSTVMGAFCEPSYCKNVLYVCKVIPF
jgi:2-polyprenyl-3-methyl-5-hydroxy-6-metoxy-1,4-benzoquinol methylase